MKFLKLILTLLLLALVSSCVQTTHTPRNLYVGNEEDDGVGGTGRTVAPRILADTYIAGKITGFGSIWVNGIRVKFNKRSYFTVDGERVSKYTMAVGEVVEIKAKQLRSNYFAKSINIRHEVIGRITSVNARLQSVNIAGQRVSFKASGIILPHVGQWLQISGYRNARGTIYASHIRLAAPGSTLVRGKLIKAKRGLRIGSLRVYGNPRLTKQIGKWVVVRGKHTRGRLQATSTIEVPDVTRDKSIQKFIIQGIARTNKHGKTFIDNMPITKGQGQTKSKSGRDTTFEIDTNDKGSNGLNNRPDNKPDNSKPSQNNPPGRSNAAPGSRGNNTNANSRAQTNPNAGPGANRGNGNGGQISINNNNSNANPNPGPNSNANANAGNNANNGNAGRTIQLAPVVGLDSAPDNVPSPPSMNGNASPAPAAASAAASRPNTETDRAPATPARDQANKGNAPERDTANSIDRSTPDTPAAPERDTANSSDRKTPETPATLERESASGDKGKPADISRETPERGNTGAAEREAPARVDKNLEKEQNRERPTDRGKRGKSD